jgi:hypothetical protein
MAIGGGCAQCRDVAVPLALRSKTFSISDRSTPQSTWN